MNVKRIMATIIALCMVVCTMSFNVFADGTSTDELEVFSYEGEGTAESPYLINNLDELGIFRDYVNTGNDYDGKYFKLVNDIDLSSVENWVPIGVNGSHTNEFSFRGYFDGNNKTISNLTISDTTVEENKLGLFGHIHSDGMNNTLEPSVKNLYLTDVNISSTDTKSYIGGLVANPYTCYIKNVHVTGTISGGKWTGGIAGNCYAVFEDCSFNGTVNSNNQAGGIAGAGDARVYNSKSIADITAKYWAGGIVGNGQEGASAVGCYVKGTITAENNWYFGVGGIAGVGGHGYTGSRYTDNYFDGEVYLCNEKVNSVVVGFVNADGNESINTTVDGNSWNTEFYSADTPVVVTAEVEADISPEEWEASASDEKSSVRNNNLVMLESDLQYVDAPNAAGVTIMDFSEVTEEEVAEAVEENKYKAFVDTNENGVIDDGETKYINLQDAIVAAAPAGTVTLLKDVTVDEWHMISETLSIGDGTIITLEMDGLTINGNGYTLTVNDVESAGNGGHLFYDGDYNIYNLNLVMGANVNGLGITSGTIKNVTFIGGHGTSGGAAIHVNDGLITGVHAENVTIEGCTFKNNGGAIYSETAQNGLVVKDNTFEVPSGANVIMFRGTEQFIGNTVVSGRTVNVVSGSPVVTGNNFGDVRLKVYNDATATIEENTINNLVFNDETAPGSAFNNNTLSEEAQAALDAVATPSGTLGTCYIGEDPHTADRYRIYGEILDVYATQSIEVKLYCGETLVGTTSLNSDIYNFPYGREVLGVNMVISGTPSGSWNTVWEEGQPCVDMCPDRAVLYIDGTEINEAEVTLATIDSLGEPYVWEDIPGVNEVEEDDTPDGGSGGPSIIRYKVEFKSNGGTKVSTVLVVDGGRVAKPVEPTKDGYIFAGWYTDEKLTKEFDFNTSISKGYILYAKWVEARKVWFEDVSENDWFYEDVKYVFEKGLMNGLSEETFAPQDNLTRAMLVTILYRNEGEPALVGDDAHIVPSFADIDMGAYYTSAVIWAQQNGIVNGVNDTEFAPDALITREQLATIMHRYAQYKKYDVAVGENTNILSYEDYESISEYAISAIQYACGSGLINGKSESTINPLDNASRAEVAAIIHRFVENR